MSVPVLIAARNEADQIGKVLASLPRGAVEPIVLSNGSTDATVTIARSFGARTFDLEAEGKMIALQHGLTHLGRRALEPVITLDADSWPCLPSKWLPALLQPLEQQPTENSAFCGGTVYRGGSDALSDAFHTLREYRHYRRMERTRNREFKYFTGRNAVFRMTADALDEVLSLPNLWPGEDRYMARILSSHGGTIGFVAGLGAAVFSDGSRRESLRERLSRTKQDNLDINYASYLAEAPPGSIPAETYLEGRFAESGDDTVYFK